MSCLQDEPGAQVHIEPNDNTTSWLMSHMPIILYINIKPVSNVQFLQNYWLLFFFFNIM